MEVTVTPAPNITVRRPGTTESFNVGANRVGPGSEPRPTNAELAEAIAAGAKEIVQGFKTVATDTAARVIRPLGDIFNAATAGADAGRDTADAGDGHARRAVIAGAAALPAVVALPAAALALGVEPDAEILDLWRRRQDAMTVESPVRSDVAGNEEAVERTVALEQAIATAPARSLAGLAVKARLVREYTDDDELQALGLADAVLALADEASTGAVPSPWSASSAAAARSPQ